jgi:flagellar assembly protein FliH
MSIDAGFARMAFPPLRDAAAKEAEESARARGHLAGFVQGLRDAAQETYQREAHREIEQAEALRAGRERVDRAVAVLAAAARALESSTVPVLIAAQDVVAASTVDLAEAIIGRELAEGAGSARSALERALAGVDPARVHVVRVNPFDLDELSESDRAAAGVRFTADPTLARGDAVTEFPDSYIDARISTAVARARAALLGGE